MLPLHQPERSPSCSAAASFQRSDLVPLVQDAGAADDFFVVDLPLTPERIRMACNDSLSSRFSKNTSRSEAQKAQMGGFFPTHVITSLQLPRVRMLCSETEWRSRSKTQHLRLVARWARRKPSDVYESSGFS